MTYPSGGFVQIVDGAGHPAFRPLTTLRAQGLELRLRHHFFYAPHEIPGYLFDIHLGGRFAGTYSALIERDAGKIPEIGHVGILLERSFYGQRLPARATSAVLPLYRAHGIREVLITFDEANRALESACSELGATHLDTLLLDGRMSKKRYLLPVPMLVPA
ncbi:hypothetical protein [Flaviaesturariibacter amylovorans]|uniref:GNAT family N-acetyltransferase n=1 Tax=Flaviaesturariibacter amylovorans TaxID=1084520 RepID=A0ABP8GES3_9BACT